MGLFDFVKGIGKRTLQLRSHNKHLQQLSKRLQLHLRQHRLNLLHRK